MADDDQDRVVEKYQGYKIYEDKEQGFYWDKGGYYECLETCQEEIDDYIHGHNAYDEEQALDCDGSRLEFQDPGGNSALRAASKTNPRIYPCPTCHAENALTRKDVGLGYQCDRCADQLERGGY